MSDPAKESSENMSSNSIETPEIEDSHDATNNNYCEITELPSTSRDTYFFDDSIPSTSRGTTRLRNNVQNNLRIPPNLLSTRNFGTSQYAPTRSSLTISSRNQFELEDHASNVHTALTALSLSTVDQSENTRYVSEFSYDFDQPEISTRYAPECSYDINQPSTSRELNNLAVSGIYPSDFLFSPSYIYEIPEVYDPDDIDYFNLTEDESKELFDLLTYGFRSFRGTYDQRLPPINSNCMRTLDLMFNVITRILGQYGGIGHVISTKSGINLVETMINVCASQMPESSNEIKMAFLRCMKDIMCIPEGRTFLLARRKFIMSVAELLESTAPLYLKCFALRILKVAIKGSPQDKKYIPVGRLLASVKRYIQHEDKNSVLARKIIRNLEKIMEERSSDTSDDDC